jgi:phytoene dehydrogenase-like protein
MTSTSHTPIIVIGGGIAGLTAAALLGRAGIPAVLLDKSSAPGGRAATRNRQGFLFNLGPHALYRAGTLHQTLKMLGVEVRGRTPDANGGFAIREGRLHTLPAGLTSLLTTGLLGLGGKFELARMQSRLLQVDTNAIQRQSLASWLDANVGDAGVRGVLEMLARVTTFTNDPDHQSAGAAIEQLQLSLRGSVLYLDGGWQTIVDGLRRTAVAGGARIVSGAHAVSLERASATRAGAVRLADGTAMRATGVIIAAGPAEVDALAGTGLQRAVPPPIRLATLDVALRWLPKPAARVAFGIDTPLYFSVHSAFAQLAPEGGALIHVSKYLRPGELADRRVERELETLMDMMQPGWRAVVESQQYLPALGVTHAEVTAAQGGVRGRPVARVPGYDNVWMAGDWVGPRGQLSDAAAASAADAVASIMAARTAGATGDTAGATGDIAPTLAPHSSTPALEAAS